MSKLKECRDMINEHVHTTKRYPAKIALPYEDIQAIAEEMKELGETYNGKVYEVTVITKDSIAI